MNNMETIINWKELIFNSLGEIINKIVEGLPNLLGAIFILLSGWVITKIIIYILKKVLRLAKVDRLTELINEKKLFGKSDFSFDVLAVIVGFVKWVLYLIFLIVASEIMNWKIVSAGIGNLLIYLPTLFSAIALFMIGIYIANFIKKAIRGLFDSFVFNGAKIFSNLVFYIIAIIITLTALNQAGVDTDIITNNLTLILGAFLATFAIAFGLGSKEIIADLLKSFYARKNFVIGQKIKFKNVSGTIESIDNIAMIIKTEKGKTVLPIKDIIENQIEIEK
jgi:hypothetical protein